MSKLDRRAAIRRLVDSRRHLVEDMQEPLPVRSVEAEGGCGVIGIACSEPLPGRHLLQALRQMRNRGNGKGGGAALAGLDPAQFGVTPDILRDDTLLAVAYLEDGIRSEVEQNYIFPGFAVDQVHEMPVTPVEGLETPAPDVVLLLCASAPKARWKRWLPSTSSTGWTARPWKQNGSTRIVTR